VSLEIPFEAMIEGLWKSLGGHDRTSLEMHLKGVVQEGGTMGAETLCIG